MKETDNKTVEANQKTKDLGTKHPLTNLVLQLINLNNMGVNGDGDVDVTVTGLNVKVSSAKVPVTGNNALVSGISSTVTGMVSNLLIDMIMVEMLYFILLEGMSSAVTGILVTVQINDLTVTGICVVIHMVNIISILALIAGAQLAVTGPLVEMCDDNVALTGMKLKVNSADVTVTGDEVEVSNMNVAATGKVSMVEGSDLAITGTLNVNNGKVATIIGNLNQTINSQGAKDIAQNSGSHGLLNVTSLALLLNISNVTIDAHVAGNGNKSNQTGEKNASIDALTTGNKNITENGMVGVHMQIAKQTVAAGSGNKAKGNIQTDHNIRGMAQRDITSGHKNIADVIIQRIFALNSQTSGNDAMVISGNLAHSGIGLLVMVLKLVMMEVTISVKEQGDVEVTDLDEHKKVMIEVEQMVTKQKHEVQYTYVVNTVVTDQDGTLVGTINHDKDHIHGNDSVHIHVGSQVIGAAMAGSKDVICCTQNALVGSAGFNSIDVANGLQSHVSICQTCPGGDNLIPGKIMVVDDANAAVKGLNEKSVTIGGVEGALNMIIMDGKLATIPDGIKTVDKNTVATVEDDVSYAKSVSNSKNSNIV